MTIEELRAALEALPRYEFTSGVGSHAHPDAVDRAAVLAALPSDGVIVSEEEYPRIAFALRALLDSRYGDDETFPTPSEVKAAILAALRKESGDAARGRLGPSWREAMDYEQGFEAGAAAERERLLDPSRLSQAIHAYGGLCRSRYGRVTCGPDDHIVMATDLRVAILADPAEPEE